MADSEMYNFLVVKIVCETEVITSKSGGTEVSTSEEHILKEQY